MVSVTIKDIAKVAGVAHSTVSRALNDSKSISDETKVRIRDIAMELGYSPNVSARSLVLDRSYNIGLFFTTMDKGTAVSFFYDVVRSVNKVIRDEYNLMVRGIDDYRHFHLISKKNFDGIVIMSQSKSDDAFITTVHERQIPMVVLNREVEMPVCNILINDRTGVFHATEYLIQNGHRKIGIIEGKEDFRSTQLRKQGYVDAHHHYDLPLYDGFAVRGDYSTESGYEAMMGLLERDVLPTAVFCSNDEMAMGAINAVSRKGLRIPEDISIMGYDDSMFAGYLTPRLTTVKRPVDEMGKKGAAKLLDLINDNRASGERYYMNVQIVERDSIRKL
ncbi:LacI family DNA-binding transcriptional regulator [Vallitalea pronyensis]|uniref:LacI family DNA-binding transcriptional regulator n=1 Tax=Vallitalea pronyensis TaxID=1348613 RepID=UPI001FE38C61|nr:LacI family DNA-binding transcriptional regulator [Vallitalea pronyensis]